MTDLSYYLRPPTHFSRWIWLSVVAFACTATWTGVQAYVLYTETLAIQERADLLRASQAAQAKAKPTVKELEEQRRWTALKQEQDFPWQQIFKAVERASSKDIELLEFQPDKRNRIIVLRGEAKEQSALLSYLDRLGLQAGLGSVHLVHQQAVTRERLESVSFEIKASLKN